MSAAFDTINRQLLLKILEPIIHEDQLRLIYFLLYNTKMATKIKGAKENMSFLSNIGTPQGDSLSPVLFIIYLEHALKEIRSTFPILEPDYQENLPREVIYADDVDFVGLEYIDTKEVQKILQKYQLKVNTDKTELTNISKDENIWKETKKVGSLMGDKEDVARRKHLSTIALVKLNNVWIRKDRIKKNTRLKLYRTLVKCLLTYNCGTWALTKTEEEKLDSFHRKQLRKILGIKYPVIITNKSLYKKCNETPLSLQILESRWRLFGHILRRDECIPANKAMHFYFRKSEHRYLGRPLTSLPITLNKDLSKL